MNSKKAKMLRKVGKTTRKDKRNYQKLNHDERFILKQIYDQVVSSVAVPTTKE
jgi:hypothetical protein